jgi:Fe-S-cluster containining protein
MFPCSRCGACCRVVGDIPDFPEPVREDGSCSHLKPDFTCAIYETRPLICQVDAWFEDQREEWHRLNADACNRLQERLGIDGKFRLTVVQ